MSAANEEDWIKISKASNGGCFPRIFDCFDEAALEMALGLRDEIEAAGKKVLLRAVTIGVKSDEKHTERLFALKYDSVTRIDYAAGDMYTPNLKAVLIADHIKKTGIPDYIFCGVQSGIGGSGMTGPMIAEYLGLPCVSNVSNVRSTSEAGLHVRISSDGGHASGRISGKAVLIVGNSVRGLLRIPTLKARRAVKDKHTDVIKASVSDRYAGVGPVSVLRPPARGICRYIEGDAKDKAKGVFDIIRDGGV